MLFAIYAIDKKDSLDVRLANRANHLEFLKNHDIDNKPVKIVTAGALRADDDFEKMIGSLVVVDCETKEQVQEFCEQDPYAKAGLFESVTIHPYGLAPLGLNKSL